MLDGRGHLAGNPLFAGDRDDSVRYAKAYVNYSAGGELGGGAARDHLAGAERQLGEVILRHARLAAVGRVELRLVGLPVVFVHDQHVDETARNADIARVERACGHDSADDGNRSPARSSGGLG